ncbi:uncharacterized protein LOC129761561 [Toxorhynchites rutilus septentrionalis]|uniref:uncharacterized protein LOC129761561 n=1 Tax=Toxorhynchites rutilus septentrionalis TaxID=329112 RepID=UPI002479D375|nr:uncharacterized protein LOC129761561 [Toxorhynchites rutilus septentrionalis]
MPRNDGRKETVSALVNTSREVSCGLCQLPDDSHMVACDECGRWYHFVCVGVDESVQDRDWSCERCRTMTAQIPAECSTPLAGGATGLTGANVSPSEKFLREQVQQLQEKLEKQQLLFESVLREREHFDALKAQQKKCKEELGPKEPRSEKIMQDQYGAKVTGAIKKTSAMTLSTPEQEEILFAKELELLEEKQAMERKHLEEKSALLQRFHSRNAETTRRKSTELDPRITDFRSMRDYIDPVVQHILPPNSDFELSRSQLAARQAVTRDLPTFSGNPEEWPLFITSFQSSTRMCGYSDEENMLRLQRSLKGKALDAVRCRLLHPSNVPGVISTLRTLFGRPEIIVHSLISKIREMPSPKAEKLNTVIDFGVAVQNVCATITASGLDEYLCNVALLQELTERLPATIKLSWAYHRQTKDKVTLSDFAEWLGKLVEAASIVSVPSLSLSKSEKRSRNYINVHLEDDENSDDNETSMKPSFAPRRECTLCQDNCSGLEKCQRFLNMNVGARWTVIKEQKLCKKCLQKHFGACGVKAQCGKNGCTYMHNQLLHEDARYNRSVAPQSNAASSVQSCNTHLKPNGHVLFRYIPVTVHAQGKTVNTYAFLDDGSSATFMESVSVPELTYSYSYLGGLPLESYEQVSPRILIGIDNCHLGHALASREGMNHQPIASQTRLGWVVYGLCVTTAGTVCASSDYKGHHNFHICSCQRDDKMNAELKEYFSIDSLGIYKTNKSLLSKDDERALNLLSTETLLKGTRYETCLLWRTDQTRLPDNKTLALRRLICLEKRMNRDADLAESMRTKIAEYEQNGYIRRLSPNEISEAHPRTWYLPIFPVVNPNKPGKFRIVWDAAAAVKGISLNSVLLTGPDQLASLLSVLHRFREFRYAVTGDIREMFHQVLVKEEDQHSQRFLWRNGDSSREPDVYVMRVMTFGAACSPSCAAYVKNHNADKFQQQFPRATECIKYDHYVDDMLTSVENEDEAVKLATEVRYVHSQAGFHIRNWLSNSSAILERLHDGEPTEKDLNLTAEMATEKVLGMWWCTATDNFTFKLSTKHDPELLAGLRTPTKREVLKTLMSIYDPMGLIANFLMHLKILLQDIWRSGIAWDDQIPSLLEDKWKLWIRILPNVKAVQIPRCYRHLTSSTDTNRVQLHMFVDSSEKGLAAVAYFRFEEDGKIECALIGSKTRVAPLKYLSIPRLELQAAVVGARLADSIVKSHRLVIAKRFFWTDSRDVMCWLRSDHRRYSSFVASRIGELLETTDVAEWKWLSTRLNVADEGTKWQKLPDFNPTSRWYRGPSFLWEPENNWPVDNTDPGTTKEELRTHMLHHTVEEPIICFQNFKQWTRLLRTMAFVFRYRANLQRKIRKEGLELGPLTQSELHNAEQFIYRQVQREMFPDEIRILTAAGSEANVLKTVLPTSSSLYKLTPVIDVHGVLRMRGRVDACQFIDESSKRPILLPKRHYLTSLVITDYHERYRHLNHQTALNGIRQKYYIPQLRSEYNRARRNCQYCKINFAKPQTPIMGDLPAARLAAFSRPFAHTGIDYFGPLLVAVGRRVEKRWGVLFTCMTIRAIHIEIAHTMTTDSCILAVRNFIARRGAPIEFLSDRGTNFIGANRELLEALKQVDQNEVMTYFVTPNTAWKFNPPASPHFGGCWERLIQSVKKLLDQFKTQRTLSDEILRNVLMEIEMMVNSRPLTHIPLDDAEASPLTPNHFLLGSFDGNKPPIAYDDGVSTIKQSWKTSQVYANNLWKKWISEYLPTLTRRTKWFKPVRPIQLGDVVVIVDSALPRNVWPKERVIGVVQAKDGQVRRVTVQTTNGILERPAVKIAVLDVGSGDSKPPEDVCRTGGNVTPLRVTNL